MTGDRIVRAGDRLEVHLQGQIHYLEIGHALEAVRDGFLRHLYQEGEEVQLPGEITPTREIRKTGNLFTPRLEEGENITETVRFRLYGPKGKGRAWVTTPGCLEQVLAGGPPVPLHELPPEMSIE